jgi:hypothetical protein
MSLTTQTILENGSHDEDCISEEKPKMLVEDVPEELTPTLSRRVTRTLGLVRQKMDHMIEGRPFEEQGMENDFEDVQCDKESREQEVADRQLTKHDVGWRYIVRNFTPS